MTYDEPEEGRTRQLTLDDLPKSNPIRNELERKYRVWLETHGIVFALFERFALNMLARQRRFGISALTERVRWEIASTWEQDVDGYKINNNYTAYIARDLIRKHPAMGALIELRAIREDTEEAQP